MIENQKLDCANTITFGIHRTGLWRGKMATQYPTDPRNGRAADCLATLAVDKTELSDREWRKLEPYFAFDSEPWREAISQTARQVGFKHRIQDMPSFITALVEVLQA